MTPSDISDWLQRIGLGQHAATFAENDIDLDVLPQLTEQDLKELGLSLGHRKKLLVAIRSLAAEGTLPKAEPGSTAEGAPVAPATSDAERRQLTVMFCDLVGSTPLSQQVDPEELHEIIGGCQDVFKSAIERYAGFVAGYMSDGVLAYFGFPQAHEDDAERAVQAGLEVVAKLAALNATSRHDIELAVRVGIATGQVVIGDLIATEGVAQESAAVGETPNFAARLQSAAAPNTVLIAASTRELVGEQFACEQVGPFELKGFSQPVPAWRVTAERRVESRFEATRGGHATPIVDREQELGLLLNRWELARQGEGQVVLLSGEPGIGKSRLAQALYDNIGETACIRVRCQCAAYHTHSALYPFIVKLERAAGFEDGDSSEVRIEKLLRFVGATPQHLQRELPLLASLLSLPADPRFVDPQLPPQRLKEETLQVLLEQLRAWSQPLPLLFLFEDAHWADPTSIELLDQLMDQAQSMTVLVLVTFRPEFQPHWTAYSHTTSLMLNRFSRQHSATMVGQVMSMHLPDDMLERIVARSDGVPLFLEEMTRSVSERLALTEPGQSVSVDAKSFAIPATLQDLLMERLDRVPEAKEVAQAASVVGREFSHDLLAAVCSLPDETLARALEQLVEAGLTFRRGTPSRPLYSFKHALVRDAAYDSLLRKPRQRLHLRIAEVLEAKFPETVATRPELLAHHYTEAGEAQRALEYWLLAGRRAAERSANREAVAHLNHGLAVVQRVAESTGRSRQELGLRQALSGPLMATTGWGSRESSANYARARELCAQLGETEQLIPVLHGQWINHLMGGELRTAREVATQLLALAERHSDRTTVNLHGHRMLGWTALLLGDLAEVAPNIDKALGLYQSSQHASLRFQYVHDARVAALCCRVGHQWLRGYPDSARATGGEAVAYATQLKHANTLAFALFQVGLLTAMAGDAEATARHARKLLVLADEQGFRLHQAWGRVVADWAAAKGGRPGAVQQLRDGIDALAAGGQKVYLPFYLGLLAELYLERQHTDEALQAIERAFELLERTHERWWAPELHRLSGEASRMRDPRDPKSGAAQFEQAITLARAAGSRSLELRAATSLARLLAQTDEARAAHRVLAAVCGQFSEGLESGDLQRARALLDTMAADTSR